MRVFGALLGKFDGNAPGQPQPPANHVRPPGHSAPSPAKDSSQVLFIAPRVFISNASAELARG